MKSILLIAILLAGCYCTSAQETETEVSPIITQQLEDMAEKDEAAAEDDQYLQRLVHFRRHPINLNRAGADELRELMMLDELQLVHFIQYRRLFGDLLSIFELQAIPGWDIETIRKLLPYVTLTEIPMPVEKAWKQFGRGESNFLVRYSRTKSQGEEAAQGNNYLGSLFRLSFRYRYQYKNDWQMGVLGDKDAGEQFFKGTQRLGFDFYSFHFFVRNRGRFKALALGDFSVNMGQGLIHWQAMAFKKGANTMAMKRQSPVLRPYHASGEFNFHRGLGLTLRLGPWQLTGFASYRKLSAALETDTLARQTYITSLPASGYHRSEKELNNKNGASLLAFGSSIRFNKNRLQTGINMLKYQFSNPLMKEEALYSLFTSAGRSFANISMDYSYTIRNFHFFGELAFDDQWHPAQLHGILASLDPKIDLSILFRSLHRAYRSLFANAFTENTHPGNEVGIYLALAMRPAFGWRIDTYIDMYRFPWLKYRVNAPGYGRDYLLQLTYTPNKRIEMYSRYRYDSESLNSAGSFLPVREVQMPVRHSWRNQFCILMNKQWTMRNRIELSWYKPGIKASTETGYLVNADFLYTSINLPFSVGLRLQYFETQGFSSRIYAYENDVLYSFSAPAFSGKGVRWYINFKVNLNQLLRWRFKWKINTWLRIAQSINDTELIDRQTEWKWQLTVSG